MDWDAIAWDDLFEGIFRRKYNFLLGAGMSGDVLDRQGEKLPLARGLRDDIVDAFDLPRIAKDPEQGESLARVYGAVEKRLTASGLSRSEWLEERFLETSPPSWFRTLGHLNAPRIWTFNIDDSLERGMDPKPTVRTWIENNDTVDGEGSVVVHVHGHASQPESIVFSQAEYADHIVSERSYAKQFSEILSSGPVIVVGATLGNEPDIARALRLRSSLSDPLYPSYVVSPTVSEFDKLDLETWHINHISARASEFFSEVAKRLPYAKARFIANGGASGGDSRQSIAFLNQWERLKFASVRFAEYRDFLSGSAPESTDIFRSLPIDFGPVDEVVEALTSDSPMVSLTGGPFVGKSTCALVALYRLHQSGWATYGFIGDQAIDDGVTLEVLARNQNSIFFVDEANLFSASIARLAEGAQKRGLTLRILCAERSQRSSRVLRNPGFQQIRMPGGLDLTHKLKLVKKLADNDRLWEQWRKMNSRERRKSIESFPRNDMASLVSELTRGEQLDRRVRADSERLSSDSWRLYLLVALLGRSAGGAAVGWVSRALDLRGRKLEELLRSDEDLAALVYERDSRLLAANRRHAEIFLKSIDQDRRDDVLGAVVTTCLAIAPEVNPRAISLQTRAYRATVTLMDSENVQKWVGLDRAVHLYEDLEAAYRWNSRYWEQRALTHATRKEFLKAHEFVANAQAAHDDPFVWTTAAKVKSDELLYTFNPQNVWEESREVLYLLSRARDSDRTLSEHPYGIAFNFMINMARESLRRGVDIPIWAEDLWRQWMDSARFSVTFRDPISKKKLRKYGADWAVVVNDRRGES
ncbi:SIR2 family protein [Micrococcus luteus]|uniref:P-loop NTPase n=1 Tax=Micrococcus luteus TaxID=1270 RepID=UPI0009B9830A|nr:SIR2 family protein [Micrococcus luteus]